MNNETTTYVLNGECRVIAHANSSIVLLETYFDLPDTVGISTGLSGEDSVIAFTRISISNEEIFVVAEQPVSVALSLVRTTAIVLGIAMIATLIIALLLATLGARFIIRPVQELALGAEKIQQGDLSQRARVNSSDEIGVLARIFNGMTEQLSQLIGTLEQRVQERTRDLQVAVDVSLQISTQLDSSKLLANVVEQTAGAFGLYHVSIFLYDEHEQVLKLKQGMGDAGNQMVALSKQLKLTEKGLVPTAAQTRQATLSNDVIQDPDHVANPLLPKTRSELAIPMIYFHSPGLKPSPLGE